MKHSKLFFKNKSFYHKIGFSEKMADKLAYEDMMLCKEFNDPRNFHLWAEAEEKQSKEKQLV